MSDDVIKAATKALGSIFAAQKGRGALQPGTPVTPTPTPAPVASKPVSATVTVPKTATRTQTRSRVIGGGAAAKKTKETVDLTVAAKPDPDYYRMPEIRMQVKKAIAAGMPVFIHGPTGTGKSEFVHRLAAELKQEVFPQNFDGDTYADEIVGSQDLVDGEKGTVTQFTYGALPQAMQAGGIYLAEEVDAAKPGTLMALQRPLEGKDLYIAKRAERVHPKEGFKIIATANTTGSGDETGIYRARQALDQAFLDRFGAFFYLGYPKVDVEVDILIRKTGISDSDARRIAEVASLAREAFEHGKVYATMGLRKTISWAKLLMAGLNDKEAFQAAVLNRLNSDDKVAFDGLYQRVTGNSAI